MRDKTMPTLCLAVIKFLLEKLSNIRVSSKSLHLFLSLVWRETDDFSAQDTYRACGLL